MIDVLIDKLDNFEVVRDQIATILATEFASQQSLARAASKNPADWKVRVFTERSNPWEEWLNSVADPSPLVSVWYDRSQFDPAKSNVIDRQAAMAIYNIDCYGLGIAKDDRPADTTPATSTRPRLHKKPCV